MTRLCTLAQEARPHTPVRRQRAAHSLSVTQDDLRAEIERLKAGEQRRVDALAALAVLESHIKQLAAQAIEVRCSQAAPASIRRSRAMSHQT